MLTYIQRKKSFFVATVLSLMVVGAVAYAAGPSAVPTGGNVDANFSSIQFPVGPKLTGSFGRFVGSTLTLTKGNIGGYTAANALCTAFSADSHVCSANEIINSYEYDSTGPIASATGNAWINNGPPAYISDLSNDCKGWTSNEPVSDGYSSYGSTWKFGTKTSLISHCSRSLPVACCSY